MTFEEIVETTRNKTKEFDVSNTDEKIAIQFDLFGDNGGTFYIELKDSVLSVEPYNYYDRDARIIMSASDYIRFIEGKLNATTAFSKKLLKIEGNVDKVLRLTNFIQ